MNNSYEDHELRAKSGGSPDLSPDPGHGTVTLGDYFERKLFPTNVLND